MTPEEIRTRLSGTRIFIVPYAHCDWAWTHTRAWHEQRYVLAFEEVLALLREDPGFRWYLDSWVTELQPFLDRRPDLVPELQARVDEGKIAICGAYSNVRPNMVGEETFLRNLILGRRRFRDLFPQADLSVHADCVDVALGHPQMPQVLRLAGYDHYRAWRPQTALSMKNIPYEFVWQGLDGSRVLSSRGCYGGLVSPDTVPEGFTDRWDETVVHLWNRELEEASRLSPSGCLWVSQGMDDARPLRSHGGDCPIDLPSLVREWNRRESAPMQFATPVEFYQALMAKREDIPVVEGTLDPCDVCYNVAWGGAHGLWRARIAADRELTTAELWQTIAPTHPDVESHFRSLWESALLFSAHATQWLFQEDFDELDGLARDTCRAARAARRQSLAALARRVPQPHGCAAIVFNHLAFERREAVPVLLTAPQGIPEQVRLIDGSGNEVPFQVTADLDVGPKVWEREAVALVSLPALGYTTLRWEQANAPSATAPDAPRDGLLDNGTLRLSFDGASLRSIGTPQGEYASPDGFAWSLLRAYDVDPNGPLHVGAIRGTEDVSWESTRTVEVGPVRWRQVSTGSVGPHPVTLETLLFAGQPRVEFQATIDWRGADGFLAVHWPMPFTGNLAGDVPFGVEAKDLDAEPYGPRPDYRGGNIERLREGLFYARSFVSLDDGRQGVTYVSHDGDRYYLRDREQGTLGQVLINSIRRVEQGWERHVNVQEQLAEGRHHFTWSILFHPGDWRSANMVRTASALRSAPEVLLPHGAPAPDLPAAGTFLRLQPANVLLSAFYTEGNAAILRVWEGEGRPAAVEVDLPFSPLTAAAVDLNDDPDPRIHASVEGAKLCFRLKPWQIATVRLALPDRHTWAGAL